MQKLDADELHVVIKENLAEGEAPSVEIINQGKPTGRWVAGAVLEAAVKTGDHFILFLIDDIPFEEMLSVQLLDDQFCVLDSVTIGSIYSTGSFSDLELTGPRELQFRFNSQIDWRLHVLPKPQFILPFTSEPKGVHRKFGFKRYFKLEVIPVAKI